jgi:outer membrane protein assembly factor BamB
VASEVDKEKAVVYGIDLENGEEKWQQELKSSILAPVSAGGGKVYVNGRLDNTVYVFDGETGSPEWSFSLSDIE